MTNQTDTFGLFFYLYYRHEVGGVLSFLLCQTVGLAYLTLFILLIPCSHLWPSKHEPPSPSFIDDQLSNEKRGLREACEQQCSAPRLVRLILVLICCDSYTVDAIRFSVSLFPFLDKKCFNFVLEVLESGKFTKHHLKVPVKINDLLRL